MHDGWYERAMANENQLDDTTDPNVDDSISDDSQDEPSNNTQSSNATNNPVDYKTQYRYLKRKLKFLIYENEFFQDAMRSNQRRLLKVSRDRTFLLDRLLQYEKPENTSSESEETESSDDESKKRKLEQKPQVNATIPVQSTSNGATRGRKRKVNIVTHPKTEPSINDTIEHSVQDREVKRQPAQEQHNLQLHQELAHQQLEIQQQFDKQQQLLQFDQQQQQTAQFEQQQQQQQQQLLADGQQLQQHQEHISNQYLQQHRIEHSDIQLQEQLDQDFFNRQQIAEMHEQHEQQFQHSQSELDQQNELLQQQLQQQQELEYQQQQITEEQIQEEIVYPQQSDYEDQQQTQHLDTDIHPTKQSMDDIISERALASVPTEMFSNESSMENDATEQILHTDIGGSSPSNVAAEECVPMAYSS